MKIFGNKTTQTIKMVKLWCNALKRHCHHTFVSPIFSHKTNISEPLIDVVKHFRICLRSLGDIRCLISMIFHKLYCVFLNLIPFKIYHRYSDNNLFVSPRCHIKNSTVSMTPLSLTQKYQWHSCLTPRCLFDIKKNIYRWEVSSKLGNSTIYK